MVFYIESLIGVFAQPDVVSGGDVFHQCHLVKTLTLIIKRAEYVEIHTLLFFR